MRMSFRSIVRLVLALLAGSAWSTTSFAADAVPAGKEKAAKTEKTEKTSKTAKSMEKKAPVRILKVLPHYLDKDGRHTVNPSLFDRDVYQAELKDRPELRSGMRFDVLWKSVPSAPAALTMKVELRGSKAQAVAPVVVTARAFARGGFSQWTRVPIVGKDYEALGELVAWRVSLWKDDQLIGEKKSFLW